MLSFARSQTARKPDAASISMRTAGESVEPYLTTNDPDFDNEVGGVPRRQHLTGEADNVTGAESHSVSISPKSSKNAIVVSATVPPPQNEAIVVSVRDDAGHVMRFSVKPHFKVSKLFKAYGGQSGTELSSVCFIYRGQVLAADTTVEAAGLNAMEAVVVTVK